MAIIAIGSGAVSVKGRYARPARSSSVVGKNWLYGAANVGPNGTPQAGVRVLLIESPNALSWTVRDIVVTADDGAFAFNYIDSGPWRVVADHPTGAYNSDIAHPITIERMPPT